MADKLPEKKCTVILGAGASYDVHIPGTTREPRSEFRPPLTAQLFDPRFHGLRNRLTGSEFLGYELASLAKAGALNLEQKLREYANDNNQRIRRLFKDIPIYIRSVLIDCSTHYYEHSGAHAFLIKRILSDHPHHVLFISLNYDVLLEHSLASYSGKSIIDMDEYVAKERQALIVKLHGSIDWLTPIGDVDPQRPEDISWEEAVENLDLSKSVELIWKLAVPHQFHSKNFSHPYKQKHVYPVLTAPLAGKKPLDIVCPASHIQAVKDFVPQCRKFLFIGTSGLDEDLLSLLNQNTDIASLVHYVGESNVEETRGRLEAGVHALSLSEKIECFKGGYQGYARSEEFVNFLKV